MGTGAQRETSPQARGRALARLGTRLWQETGSVPAAAQELLRLHRDLPRLQAFRYACGLSQEQAAARYNEVSGHRTTLGGTTINAWETWARGQGAGSPPPLSALLLLAAAYARGPLGVASDSVTPVDLVGGIEGRLAPEDRVALRSLPSVSVEATLRAGSAALPSGVTEVTAAQEVPLRLVTSAEAVSAALLEVVDAAQEWLVAVGSRSREPAYLRRIEQAVRDRPRLVHYRILIGPPHTQLLKDHLLELLDTRAQGSSTGGDRRLRLCLLQDLAADHERFFTASERAAVVVLPSVNSPANFDTALVVDDPVYAGRLVEHGQALYGQRVLDTPAAVHALPVLR